MSPACGAPATKEGQIRRQFGKARTGCQSCKDRRLKCDETEPACKNCSKQSLQCPGYARQLRWSRKHEHFISWQHTPKSSQKLSGKSLDCTPGVIPPTSSKSVLLDDGRFVTTNRVPMDTSYYRSHNHVEGGSPAALYQQNSVTGRGRRYRPLASSDAAKSSTSDAQRCLDYTEDFSIYHNPTHLSTGLIEYWFNSICSMWSTFDSEVNFNRRIALDHWTTSKPVFLALQAMSAAYLADSVSSVRTVLPAIVRQATAAIQESMAAVVSGAGLVAIDLVFAVFALGTSSHWSSPSVPGDSLLTCACKLLDMWKSNEDLTAIDTILYGYFQQALTYWQMTRCITCCKSSLQTSNAEISKQFMASIDASSASEILPSVKSRRIAHGTRPNSWCGVSDEVVAMFGKVVSLCQNVRQRLRDRRGAVFASHTDVVLIEKELASEYQRQLLAMDFQTKVRAEEYLGFSLQTLDTRTPVLHLIHIAEAYRQASLLQLLLTFESLQAEFPTSVSASVYYSHSCEADLIPLQTRYGLSASRELALDLVSTLRMIPIESGSRCLQPVLYISVAAGLRLDICSSNSANQDAVSSQPSGFTAMTPEIPEARKFVLSRLSGLQLTFPARPITTCIDLVKAIWRHYDDTKNQEDLVHWLDVMMDTGLHTMFR